MTLPSEGLTPVVLAAVEDLGTSTTVYGSRRQVRLIWVLDEKDPVSNETMGMGASGSARCRLYWARTGLAHRGCRPAGHNLLGAGAKGFRSHAGTVRGFDRDLGLVLGCSTLVS
jgi:hypothetical protein